MGMDRYDRSIMVPRLPPYVEVSGSSHGEMNMSRFVHFSVTGTRDLSIWMFYLENELV